MIKQRTLHRTLSFQGKGIHTGRAVNLTVRPAAPESGIRFCRVDLNPALYAPAVVGNVREDEMRQTTLVVGNGVIRTIEHLMAAFHGMGVDNALVEVDGDELPAMDGSSLPFTEAIQQAGLTEQDAPRHWIEVDKPVYVDRGDQSLIILPDPNFKISYTLSYRH